MSKLSRRQEQNIIVAYATGSWSIRDLAKKYGVSKDTISNILNNCNNAELRTKSDTIKKKEEEEIALSMREFFASKRDTVQGLIGRLLNLSDEQIQAASLRDKMGAIKILKECFGDMDGEGDGVDDTPATIEVVVEDASADSESPD